MTLQEEIDNFKKEQSLKGADNDQIGEALYLAFNIAMSKTLQESEIPNSEALINEIFEKAKAEGKFPDESEFQDKLAIKVNEKGETLGDVFARNAIQTLKEISEKVSS